MITLSNVKRFKRNEYGIDYVVGDIHGAFSKLKEELELIGFNTSVDRLFCTGDLVDRGSESEVATDWIFKPWFFSVRGNHEQLTIDAFDKGRGSNEEYLHSINGGDWYRFLPSDHRANIAEVFRSLPHVIEIETDKGLMAIIHADMNINDWCSFKNMIISEDDKAIQACMWGRTRIKTKDQAIIFGVDKVYVGHTIVKNPLQLGNVHYIDTCGWHNNGCFTIVRVN